MPAVGETQNITLRLSKQTLQKARVLAAERATSISGLLTSQIEKLVEANDEYEIAMKRAFSRMERGFHMGDIPELDRDALHER
jgi:hypothetical protein